MDPLAITMDLSGFLSLAIQISQILREYTETVKSAPTDARNILTRVDALVHILDQLKDFLEDKDDGGLEQTNFHEQSALITTLKLCREAIESLYKTVRKFVGTGKGKSHQWWKQLMWPFQKEDCTEIIERLHRYSQIFTFSLTMSNWYINPYPSFILLATLIDEATCSKLLAKTSAELHEYKKGLEAMLEFAPELSTRIDSLSKVVGLISLGVQGIKRKTENGRAPNSVQSIELTLGPRRR